MAWAKSSWEDVIGTNGSKQSISAGSASTGDVDCNGTNKYISLAVKVVVVFGSSPDDNVTVEIFGLDADGANEVDTIAIFSCTITEETSTEVRATYQVNVSALDQVRVSVTNNDSTDAVTVWVSASGGYLG